MSTETPNPEDLQDGLSPEQVAENEALPEDRIEALNGELEQLRAQSLIERADLENQRKRMARDIENARRFANGQAARRTVRCRIREVPATRMRSYLIGYGDD